MNSNHLQSTSLLPIIIRIKDKKDTLAMLTIKGYIHEDGFLAAHRKLHFLTKAPLNKQWKITHIPTGSNVGIIVSSKEKAISCMITLTQHFDWSFTDTKNLSDHKKKQMRELITELNTKYQ